MRALVSDAPEARAAIRLLVHRIFEPLGMNDTGLTVPEAQLDRVATCYQTDLASGEVTVLEEPRPELLARPCVFEPGGARRQRPAARVV